MKERAAHTLASGVTVPIDPTAKGILGCTLTMLTKLYPRNEGQNCRELGMGANLGLRSVIFSIIIAEADKLVRQNLEF